MALRWTDPTLPDAVYIAVHPVPDDARIQPPFDTRQVDALGLVKRVRCVIHPKVLVDTLFLDKGVLAPPVDHGRL